ncbi:hypothetical protein Xoosp13_379 [Xanthomonas phage Xoo-sp13]|nr:hypothetical protein Xoosp13_379 [Xanthomonas phage Xoo-sp13]
MTGHFNHRLLSREIHSGVHSYSIKHQYDIRRVGNFLGLIGNLSSIEDRDFSISVEAVKATIPKGTRYYVATQPNGVTHYVSERLLIHTDRIIKRMHSSLFDKLKKY